MATPPSAVDVVTGNLHVDESTAGMQSTQDYLLFLESGTAWPSGCNDRTSLAPDPTKAVANAVKADLRDRTSESYSTRGERQPPRSPGFNPNDSWSAETGLTCEDIAERPYDNLSHTAILAIERGKQTENIVEEHVAGSKDVQQS
ncbi:hypothetical protein PAXINDRAFT_152782 [Paxillus involutus ATCC 200175]|nr:hypothetical protein PAXINDRAFT_152782 [Paxillus involutus ATCC 200175]